MYSPESKHKSSSANSRSNILRFVALPIALAFFTPSYSLGEPVPRQIDVALSDFCIPEDGPPPRNSADTRRGSHPHSKINDVSPDMMATYWPVGSPQKIGGIGPVRPFVRPSHQGIVHVESLDGKSLGQEGSRFVVTTCLGWFRRNVSPRSGSKPVWFSRSREVVKGSEQWRIPDFISQYTPEIGVQCTGTGSHYFVTGQYAQLYVQADSEPFSFAREIQAPRKYKCTPGVRLLNNMSLRVGPSPRARR